MKKIVSNIKKYIPFMRASAMDLFAYKFHILSWIIVSALQVLCVIFLWIAVYQSSTNGLNSVINGFNFKEMIMYVTFINIFTFVTFNNDTLFYISEDIKQGTIAMTFLKPISYRIRYIFSMFGSLLMGNLIVGLPMFTASYLVFYFIGFLEINSIFTATIHILLFVVSQILAALINDSIAYIVGIVCFYTNSAWGLNQFKNVMVSFLSGSLLPLAFFPEGFKQVLTYSPFAGLGQNPVLILLMKVEVTQALFFIGLSLGWFVIIELFACLLFKNASKKIIVQGG